MPTLAESTSKVSIDSKLLSQKLTLKRRNQLRREAFKALIRSKPYGERVRMSEIRQALYMATEGGDNTWLQKELKRGEIVRHEISPRTFFYTVDEPATVTIPKAIEPKQIPLGLYTFADLEAMAIKFTWYHPDATIPDFIAFIKEGEGSEGERRH